LENDRLNCEKLWPAPGILPDLHWGYLAGKLGADPKLLRPFLIGLRGLELGQNESHETVAKPAYDDAAILLAHETEPFVFKFATHAYQLDSKLSPDVDGDGRGDVATIRPGAYVLTLATENPYPIFVLTTPSGSGNIPAFRDTNHDGHYSAEELARPSIATAVLLHSGWDAPADSAHRSSIACQTCSVTNLRFIAKVTRKYGKALDYRLINATDAIALMADFDPSTSPTIA
jgi:hypothetical protein